MNSVLRMITIVVPLLFLSGVAAAPGAGYAPPAPGQVELGFDRGEAAMTVGDRFTLPSVVTNTGTAPTEPFVAHLNVASLTAEVYVDPEDWSASRSKELPSIPPGGRESLVWQLQAVNAGSFDVYVVLLPDGPSSAGGGALVVSPPVHVTVAARQTFSAGGALPVSIAVPVILGLVAVAPRYRHRRTD